MDESMAVVAISLARVRASRPWRNRKRGTSRTFIFVPSKKNRATGSPSFITTLESPPGCILETADSLCPKCHLRFPQVRVDKDVLKVFPTVSFDLLNLKR